MEYNLIAIKTFLNSLSSDTEERREKIGLYFGEPNFKPIDELKDSDDEGLAYASLDSATAFRESGCQDMCIDFLIALNDFSGNTQSVIISDFNTPNLSMLLAVPKVPDYYLIFTDLKLFLHIANTGDFSKLPELHHSILWISAKKGGISDKDVGEMDEEEAFTNPTQWADTSVPGVWFDAEDDWGYTPLAKMFDKMGFAHFAEPTLKSIVKSQNYIIEVSITELRQLLNWNINSLSNILNHLIR